MKPFSETRGPVFELTRHFVARMFDSELFSAGGSWRSAAIGAFSMFLVTGVAAFYSGRPSGGHARVTIAGESGRMLLFMAISGLLAVFQWQALLPSRRDYLVLAGLPVRPREVFTARFLAFGLFAVAAVATLTFLPALFAPQIAKEHSFLMNAGARCAASSMACLFALFAMVAIQGILLNALPARIYARCSAYAQGISAAIFFLGALESWHVAEWADAATFLDSFAWAPPVWFACLQAWWLGSGNAVTRALGERAVWACGAAFVSAVAIYFVSYTGR